MKVLYLFFTLIIFLSCNNSLKHHSGYSANVKESKKVNAFIAFLDSEAVSADTSCQSVVKHEGWLEYSWKPTYILGFNTGYEIKSFGFIHLKIDRNLDLPDIKFKRQESSEWKNAILDLSGKGDHLFTIPKAAKLESLAVEINGCLINLSPAQ